MRRTYISVEDFEDGQAFKAYHCIDLNISFMNDAACLDYLRTVIKDLNTEVDNRVYQYKNSHGMAEQSDEPARQEGEAEGLR